MDSIKLPALIKSASFIDGNWKSSSKTFPVVNPANQELLAEVADATPTEMSEAINAASIAFKVWKKTTAYRRRELLKEWHRLIIENVDDLARLLTLEQGKPLTEARGEILYGASMIDWYADEAVRVYGETFPSPVPSRRSLLLKQPVGVVAAITPWNFPNAMITRKLAPALAAGCTVVLKPAPDTPLSALALAELADQAGFPAGVINIVATTAAEEAGKLFCSSSQVNKVTFTGSTNVGKLLYAQCADTVKRISLELGGNAPFIVFEDADLDKAVEGVMASKFRNAGQTCVCANRVLVAEAVYDTFREKLIAAMKKLVVGDGLDGDTQIGPLISSVSKVRIDELLENALESGAKLTFGGELLKGQFYAPTLMEAVKPDMSLFQQEIFGPVVSLIQFKKESEAVSLANHTEYGLAAYFYTQNMSRIWRVSEKLEYGIVGVNEGVISSAELPFGGLKESGLGREGGTMGMDEYIEVKAVSMGGIM